MSDDSKVAYATPTGQYDVLIPWSGGFDSTALILKALEEKKSVAWCAYTMGNNPDQSAAESQARLRIKAYLSHRGFTLTGSVTDHFESTIPSDNRYLVPRLIVASTVLGPSAKEVWLGYTRSDCHCPDWKFEDHAAMAPLIQGLWSITRTSPPPVVRFPFLDTDKVDMLKYYNDYRPVFRMLATCQEGFNDTRYCNCDKCRRLESLRDILDSSLAPQS